MQEDIKLYVKTEGPCMQCTMMKKEFIKKGIPFTELKGEDHVEEIKALGFQSYPVVITKSFGSWAGFRPDRLKDIIANIG